MDPITATMVFLCTPAGQLLANKLIEVDTAFITIIGDFIKSIHAKTTKAS